MSPTADFSVRSVNGAPRRGRVNRWVAGAFLVLIFAGGLGVRLPHLASPPFEFHPTRQLRSALIGRAYYLDRRSGAPAWQLSVARAARHEEGTLEPPIMELSASVADQVIGHETLWVPRLGACILWLLGAAFSYAIAARLGSRGGGVIAAAFVTFLPFAVRAGRSFQPDPLMVAAMTGALFLLVRFGERPSQPRLVAAGLVSGFAIFVKPVDAFVIWSVFLAVLSTRGLLRSQLRLVAIFAAISVPLVALYYADGLFWAGFLRNQGDASFVPRLLFHASYYRGVAAQLNHTVGIEAAALAVVVPLFATRGLARRFVVAAVIGYLIFAVVFDYHASTHDYYQLQVVPLVGVGLGLTWTMVWRLMSRRGLQRQAVSVLVVSAVVVASVFVARGVPGYLPSIPSSTDALVAKAKLLGGLVDHSPRVLMLSDNSGKILEYYGWIAGEPWPIQADLNFERVSGKPAKTVSQRFDEFRRRLHPDWFLVDAMDEFRAQPDLVAFLTSSYRIVSSSPDYAVFDLRTPLR